MYLNLIDNSVVLDTPYAAVGTPGPDSPSVEVPGPADTALHVHGKAVCRVHRRQKRPVDAPLHVPGEAVRCPGGHPRRPADAARPCSHGLTFDTQPVRSWQPQTCFQLGGGGGLQKSSHNSEWRLCICPVYTVLLYIYIPSTQQDLLRYIPFTGWSIFIPAYLGFEPPIGGSTAFCLLP